MRVLYLSYNGLTSLIGRAQVWPYLRGLAESGHGFDILSFEEPARRALLGAQVARETAALGLAWHPQRFRRWPPLLAKWLDARAMASGARAIAARGQVQAIHARSYVAGAAGLALKARTGLPLIFDMRGFWIDEKIEGGRWPQSNPLYAAITRVWRAEERALIGGADHIVVLAEAARRLVQSWPGYRGQPVSVIPCAIDHARFALRSPQARAAARARAGIAPGAVVLTYLGSLGSVYRLGEMLRFFAHLATAHPGARFLLIGWHDRAWVEAEARAAGVDPTALVLQPAEHGEVASWLAAADLAIAFRVSSFSAAGVSLTKLGEYLAAGLPVVVNDCAGDIRATVARLGAGLVLDDLTEPSLAAAAGRCAGLLATDPARLRAAAQPLHDLPAALTRYRAVYDQIAGLAA